MQIVWKLCQILNRGGVFDVTLTDIPYAEVNRKDNGLRNLNKSNADIPTFDIKEFLEEIYRHIGDDHNFRINPKKTVFYGKCGKCQKAGK